MTNWYPALQSAYVQSCPVRITERRKAGRSRWETHHPAHQIVVLNERTVILDDRSEIALRDIAAITVETARPKDSPFVGRRGSLRYTVLDTLP